MSVLGIVFVALAVAGAIGLLTALVLAIIWGSDSPEWLKVMLTLVVIDTLSNP